MVCGCGGIGRRTALRWQREQSRGGSSPLIRTIEMKQEGRDENLGLLVYRCEIPADRAALVRITDSLERIFVTPLR